MTTVICAFSSLLKRTVVDVVVGISSGCENGGGDEDVKWENGDDDDGAGKRENDDDVGGYGERRQTDATRENTRVGMRRCRNDLFREKRKSSSA